MRWTGLLGPSIAVPMRQNATSATVGPDRELARFLGALLLSLLLPACASTSSPESGSAGAGGGPLRIFVRDYSHSYPFELVAGTEADRKEYYSRPRRNAGRKYQTHEAMEALVDYLEKQGVAEYAKPGRAPSTHSEVIRMALEVERGGETRCWLFGKGTERKEGEQFMACVHYFLDAHLITDSHQVLDNPEGRELFRDRRGPSTKR